MKTVADRLKYARGLKEWTQAQLAVAADVSTGTIGNIESGARQSKGSLPQIADALEVRHKWLAYGQQPIRAAATKQHEGRMDGGHAAREPEPTYHLNPKVSSMARTIATMFDAMPDKKKQLRALSLCIQMMQEDQWPDSAPTVAPPKQANGGDA